MLDKEEIKPENFPEEDRQIKADANEAIKHSREQIVRAQNILAAEVYRLGRLLEREHR